jgi:2-iminobutanoate/2-iminopropanoate deaminase
MNKKIRIETNLGPPATGTYSQAVRTSDLVFVTGQTGRDPKTGKVESGLEAQMRRVLSNIDAILNAACCTSADIVKVTLLMTDIKDFKAIDRIYAAWLADGATAVRPARTAFQAAALPAGALVMLDVVAACPVRARGRSKRGP